MLEVMMMCAFWSRDIKSTAAPPCSPGSPAAGEASCQVVRALEQPGERAGLEAGLPGPVRSSETTGVPGTLAATS